MSPDSQSYLKIDKLHVGHTRLSIIDHKKVLNPDLNKGNILVSMAKY